MKTTRQRIFETLQVRRQATPRELSQSLHVTSSDVRYHLAALVKEGLVESVGQRTSGGRGRPAQLYGLVEQFSEHNLDRLASALLANLMGDDDLRPNDPDNRLQALAERLAAGYKPGHKPLSRQAGQRLVRVVDFLNENRYQARWEAHADGPRIILGHCPYAAILNQHPELCRLDALLLENLLGLPVEQLARLQLVEGAVRQCVFAARGRT